MRPRQMIQARVLRVEVPVFSRLVGNKIVAFLQDARWCDTLRICARLPYGQKREVALAHHAAIIAAENPILAGANNIATGFDRAMDDARADRVREIRFVLIASDQEIRFPLIAPPVFPLPGKSAYLYDS